ncbi:MAG TPA: type I restriction endonuclease subunit R [Ktedonobacterales bacterium]|jgi:type I restriction enzyme R subunit
MKDYTEDALVEQPTIALLKQLGWQHINCFRETFGESGTLGRETEGEVALVRRLRAALLKLNPTASAEAIAQAIAELTRDRSAMSPAAANREVYTLLKDNIVVHVRAANDPNGNERDETIRIIDWTTPANNDFLLASQLWVAGDMYRRRPDLIGFVNGIPLVFVELKAVHRRLEHAYQDNLRDYKDTIPHLFCYNALILLSNGSQTRVGSLTAGWEHFFEWKKIASEDEPGVISLDTVLRGVCDHTRLLDLVENFILYRESGGALIKILAQNHQYLGVNNALEAVRAIRANQGRLGVFWHTQGSGKSLSMIFFSQKVLRKLPGAWTFLVVTDRQELDGQIYQTFATTGAVTEDERAIHAASGEHLKQLLTEQHRYLFTLIQKFHTEPGTLYPEISARDDIIVITDEAHRSQYDQFAANMRRALPNAAFLAFTGTPLITGEEEKTREVFGDYVSIYNFSQSIEDGATLPLYYENRIPELQLTNPNLNADIEGLIEAADLDDDQERKLEREFAREYHLITRDDRLEKIAEDLVAHFIARGQPGKAMVVSVDKATAVRMYDKVRAHWQRALTDLRAQLNTSAISYPSSAPRPVDSGATPPAVGATAAPLSEAERARLQDQIAFMEATDMAVVVSQSQNEIDDFHKKGLDIATHRRRMGAEDLETKFKDPNDPLRIVFVCAMWMTGFDVPSLTTIYLDKPMRNHTLMQTIARANRVFADKTNGLIVDYVGVFRNLQKALAIYGGTHLDGMEGDEAEDMPTKDKSELVAALRQSLADLDIFCDLHGIDVPALLAARGFDKARLLDDAVDTLVANDDIRRHFLGDVAQAALLYRAILPDTSAGEFTAVMSLYVALSKKIRALSPEPDINGVMAAIDKLLDASIASEGYVINDKLGEYATTERYIDLSQIDFDALRARFEQARQHILAQELRSAIEGKLHDLIARNRTRMNYQERFERLIADYNAGSLNVQQFFDQLLVLARDLNAEDKRAIAEELNEEQLAIFDLLTRPNVDLSERDRQQVKRVARDLLETLKREKLVLDWKKRQATRAAVKIAIEKTLDQELPDAYTHDLYEQKCDQVFQHIYDNYLDATHNIYAA